jgi:hypothetical protein
MNKRHVVVLIVAAFLLGMWVGDMAKSPVAAQSTASQRPMFQEVVVPDKSGGQGAVYMIYNGPGQICPASQTVVSLKGRTEKPASETPAYKAPAAAPTPYKSPAK